MHIFSAHYQLRLSFHQLQKLGIEGQFFSFQICCGMTGVYASLEQTITLAVIMAVNTAKVRTNTVDGTEIACLERTMSKRLYITPNLNYPVV